jgi:phospholipid transport system substrate-binding protein
MPPLFRSVVCAAAALFVPVAAAQDLGPEALVKSVTEQVIAVVKQDPDIQAGNKRKTIALVEQKVLPHFDFTRMTALATGVHWRKATPEQQKVLVEQFRTLLVRTYSTALSTYRNQVIDIRPLRGQATDSEVVVRSEVKQSGAESVAIDYSMEKTLAGWKVYDVAVAGVSLVTTYRETFAQAVQSGGIEGLIKSLSDKNQQLAAKGG